jgi:HK97 family phage portal protein
MNKYIKSLIGSFGRYAIKAAYGVESGWHVFTSGFRNTSDEKVNNQTAMTVSSLYACIRNVSEDVGKLPLNLYRKDGKSRFEVTDNPVVRLIKYQPNPRMDAMSFRETMNAQAMGWGNAYAEIQRNVQGDPVALWPLRPDRVKIQIDTTTQRMFYRIMTEDGHSSDIYAEDIFHLHGLGFDGITGYNVVLLASQCVGAAIAMDKFAGSYFANGMHQSGNLKHPGHLSEEAQTRLKKQLQANYGGADQAHQTLILEEGMEFISNTIDPKASQMIETRKFSVTDFCRWLRVPPHKVADLTKSAFSNIEQQNIDYVQDAITGWCKRWEMALWTKLLNEEEKQSGLFFSHVVEGMLRGDIKTRSEAYSSFWDRGIMSINEIRTLENLNPIDGGDVHFVPMNYTKLEDAGSNDVMINEISSRIARREILELEKRVKYAKDDMPRFKAWLGEFYEKHDKYITDAISSFSFFSFDSINIDMFSLKLIMSASNAPDLILEDRKDKHADYIANNLRSYYEDRNNSLIKEKYNG